MKNIKITEILVTLVGIVFAVGINTFFAACQCEDETNCMACHWAQMAVFGFALSIGVTSLISLFMKNKGIKIGISLAVCVQGVIAALIPGIFIRLCMMPDMRCNAIMRPCTIVACAILVILSVINIVLLSKDIKKES